MHVYASVHVCSVHVCGVCMRVCICTVHACVHACMCMHLCMYLVCMCVVCACVQCACVQCACVCACVVCVHVCCVGLNHTVAATSGSPESPPSPPWLVARLSREKRRFHTDAAKPPHGPPPWGRSQDVLQATPSEMKHKTQNEDRNRTRQEPDSKCRGPRSPQRRHGGRVARGLLRRLPGGAGKAGFASVTRSRQTSPCPALRSRVTVPTNPSMRVSEANTV